jgi:hypothetical protein
MILSQAKKINLELQDFLSETEYNYLKTNYKGELVAFYVFIDNVDFKGQYIDGASFYYYISKQAIENIVANMQLNLPVYASHKKPNQNEIDRLDFIGKTIYKTTTYLRNGVFVGIVGFIIENKELYNSNNYDAISLEGRNLKLNGDNVEFIEITAFALTNSSENEPAGNFAYKIDEVQLYFKKNDDKISMADITFEDIKDYIRKNKIKPSELFDSYSIIGSIELKDGAIDFDGGDEKITNILKQKFKKYVIDEKEKIEQYKKYSEEYLNIKPKFEEYKNHYLENLKVNKLNEYLTNNQVDQKLQKFILKNLDDFKVESEEDLDKNLQSFINKQKEKFQIILEEFLKDSNNNHNNKENSNEREREQNYF